MKKITLRAAICLCLAMLLIAGTLLYVFRFFRDGGDWVSYPANSHMYSSGLPSSGAILDQKGVVLASFREGRWQYHDSSAIRLATLHAVGDKEGKIGVGALNAFADKLTGYNIISGARPVFGANRQLYLTLDSEVCRVAYQAMNGLKGTIGVYNYQSGEILCMVSAPSYDPTDPPLIEDGDERYEGAYINRLLSATFIPGSTFKLVTAAAALETLPDIETRSFNCSGSTVIGNMTITCPQAHGELDFGQALTVSCNCVFGALAVELGADTMTSYVDSTGLTDRYSINGLHTAASSFDFNTGEAGELAWSGIGQGKDLVNPCSLMVYMGAIANGGRAATPQLISSLTTKDGLKLSIYLPHRTSRLLQADTAETLTRLMRDNVINNYGEWNFPGLTVAAKSGTAQSDTSEANNAWFAGFLADEAHPLAFVVLLEGGGSGSGAAASAANQVLQAAISAGY